MSDLGPEAIDALAFIPKAKEISALVEAHLPKGTHFGVLILVPGEPEGRVVAITSDRKVVAHAAAQWVIEVLR